MRSTHTNSAAPRNSLKKSTNEGYILITVLVTVAVVMLLGTALLEQSVTALRSSRSALNWEQSLYLADAGIERAYVYVIDTPELTLPINLASRLGTGRYEVILQDRGDGTIGVRSTGYVGTQSRTVEATLTPPGKQVPVPFSDFAVMTEADTLMLNNVQIYGDMYVGGSAELRNGVTVRRHMNQPGSLSILGTAAMANHVSAEGGICTGGTASTGATCTAPVPQRSLPTVHFDQLEAEATRVLTGNSTLGGSQAGEQLIFVNGDLVIDSELLYSGKLIVVTTGELRFNRNVKPHWSCGGATQCTASFMSEKGIVVTSNNLKLVGLFFTPGYMHLSNNLDLAGQVVSGTLVADNNVRVTYSPVVVPEGLGPTTEGVVAETKPVLLSSWQEIWP